MGIDRVKDDVEHKLYRESGKSIIKWNNLLNNLNFNCFYLDVIRNTQNKLKDALNSVLDPN